MAEKKNADLEAELTQERTARKTAEDTVTQERTARKTAEDTATKATERAEKAESALASAQDDAAKAMSAATEATDRAETAEGELAEASALIEQLQQTNVEQAKELARLRPNGPGKPTIEVDGKTFRITIPALNIKGAVVKAGDLTEAQARVMLAKKSGALVLVEPTE